MKDNQGALADYAQAIRINPKFVPTYYNRAGLRDELGDRQGAIADYTQAIQLNPELADAYYSRGLIFKAAGNQREAHSDFQKAVELYQKQGNTEWYGHALNQLKRVS